MWKHLSLQYSDYANFLLDIKECVIYCCGPLFDSFSNLSSSWLINWLAIWFYDWFNWFSDSKVTDWTVNKSTDWNLLKCCVSEEKYDFIINGEAKCEIEDFVANSHPFSQYAQVNVVTFSDFHC